LAEIACFSVVHELALTSGGQRLQDSNQKKKKRATAASRQRKRNCSEDRVGWEQAEAGTAQGIDDNLVDIARACGEDIKVPWERSEESVAWWSSATLQMTRVCYAVFRVFMLITTKLARRGGCRVAANPGRTGTFEIWMEEGREDWMSELRH